MAGFTKNTRKNCLSIHWDLSWAHESSPKTTALATEPQPLPFYRLL